jgi:hypothetical protein
MIVIWTRGANIPEPVVVGDGTYRAPQAPDENRVLPVHLNEWGIR